MAEIKQYLHWMFGLLKQATTPDIASLDTRYAIRTFHITVNSPLLK